MIRSPSSDARAKLRADLSRDGFAVCPYFLPELTTEQVATELGRLVDISRLLPGSGIKSIQTLVPKQATEVGRNQYSGNYGFGEFPLHTDLAHWALPPRYFILRCVTGSKDVFTHVLPWEAITDMVGLSILARAVFATRMRRNGYSTLLKTMSNQDGVNFFRWDPVFLCPINSYAQQVADAISSSNWSLQTRKILLQRPSDTLLIDNWRTLHGRAKVSAASATRRVERVYLSEVSG